MNKLDILFFTSLAIIFLFGLTVRGDNFQPVIISSDNSFQNVTITICDEESICNNVWNQTFLSTSTRSSAVVYLEGFNSTYNDDYFYNVYLDGVLDTNRTRAYLGRSNKFTTENESIYFMFNKTSMPIFINLVDIPTLNPKSPNQYFGDFLGINGGLRQYVSYAGEMNTSNVIDLSLYGINEGYIFDYGFFVGSVNERTYSSSKPDNVHAEFGGLRIDSTRTGTHSNYGENCSEWTHGEDYHAYNNANYEGSEDLDIITYGITGDAYNDINLNTPGATNNVFTAGLVAFAENDVKNNGGTTHQYTYPLYIDMEVLDAKIGSGSMENAGIMMNGWDINNSYKQYTYGILDTTPYFWWMKNDTGGKGFYFGESKNVSFYYNNSKMFMDADEFVILGSIYNSSSHAFTVTRNKTEEWDLNNGKGNITLNGILQYEGGEIRSYYGGRVDVSEEFGYPFGTIYGPAAALIYGDSNTVASYSIFLKNNTGVYSMAEVGKDGIRLGNGGEIFNEARGGSITVYGDKSNHTAFYLDDTASYNLTIGDTGLTETPDLIFENNIGETTYHIHGDTGNVVERGNHTFIGDYIGLDNENIKFVANYTLMLNGSLAQGMNASVSGLSLFRSDGTPEFILGKRDITRIFEILLGIPQGTFPLGTIEHGVLALNSGVDDPISASIGFTSTNSTGTWFQMGDYDGETLNVGGEQSIFYGWNMSEVNFWAEDGTATALRMRAENNYDLQIGDNGMTLAPDFYMVDESGNIDFKVDGTTGDAYTNGLLSVGTSDTQNNIQLLVSGNVNVTGDIHHDGSLISYSPLLVEDKDGEPSEIGMRADNGEWVGCSVEYNAGRYNFVCKPSKNVDDKQEHVDELRVCNNMGMDYDKEKDVCVKRVVETIPNENKTARILKKYDNILDSVLHGHAQQE